jgi:signal transduction histidine kinase
MRELFQQNETVILFVNGLVFFALGFAVWLQRRRATRLRLTSSLIWLATFAFVEAFAVWGYVFVPIQEASLDSDIITVLVVVRALLQGLAFALLLQFGLRLLDLTRQSLIGLSALSVLWYFAVVFGNAFLADANAWSVEEWEASVVAMLRYTLLIPGAVLSAIGLWRQRESLGVAGMAGIRPYAAAAAAALLMYAVVGGLVVDDAPWVPGGLAGQSGWEDVAGIQIWALRAAVGLVLCVLAVKLLEIFEVEAVLQLEALDRARLVAEERARFGRDLHDGTIQSIYAAGLQLEATAMRVDDDGVRGEIRRIVAGLNDVIEGIRGYIRGLSDSEDTAIGIAAALQEVSAHHERDSGRAVRFRVIGVDLAGPMPEGGSEHLGQILREALSNTTRHGGDCRSTVYLSFSPDELELQVRDDGVGMDARQAEQAGGYGLRNMRERARRLGGRMNVYSEKGNGTRLIVSIPLDSDVLEDSELGADANEKVTV